MTIHDPTAPTMSSSSTQDQSTQPGTTRGVEAGKQVASEVAHQAADVATEAKSQITNVVDRTRHELTMEASNQADRGLHGLRTLSDQMAALAAGRPEEAGHFGEVVSDAGRRLQQYMTSLEERGSRGLVEDVQRFARRRPGMFLAAAVMAGFVTGRIVRAGGMSASSNGHDSSGNGMPVSGLYGSTMSPPRASTIAPAGMAPTTGPGLEASSESFTGTLPSTSSGVPLQ